MNPLVFTGLALALFGPGAIAILGEALTTNGESLPLRATTLFLFVLLTAIVVLIARLQGPGLRHYGFAGKRWYSIPMGLVLAAFFILVYGPAAYTALSALGFGGFESGLEELQVLPTWYLVLVVLIVASTEEWLYRAYAIETLQKLTHNRWLAAGISLAVFTLVHLPLWGPGPALSIIVSGAIFTGLYLWRRDIILLITAHVLTDLYGIVLTRL